MCLELGVWVIWSNSEVIGFRIWSRGLWYQFDEMMLKEFDQHQIFCQELGKHCGSTIFSSLIRLNSIGLEIGVYNQFYLRIGLVLANIW